MEPKQNFLIKFFGQISWVRPSWLNSACQKTNPKLLAGFLTAGLLLIIVCYTSYQWYLQLPKPALVTTSFTTPAIQSANEEPKPQPLIINFSADVAPLNQINKVIKQGISISPTVSGTWQWQGGNSLIFTPTESWPAGEKYTVTFNKELLAEHTKLAKWSDSFTTTPFAATISDFRFYQDPTDPRLKQAVATLNFNYPVATKTLADHINLRLLALKQGQINLAAKTYNFTLTYDKYKRTAYLRSEPLTLDSIARYLQLTIAKDLPPLNGNNTTAPNFRAVLIPDLGSFFKINTITARIVRDQNDKPEQVLIIETTAAVTTADLQKALHVFQLPAKQSTDSGVWNTTGEVSTETLAASKPITLQAIPTDQQYSTLHSFKFNAEGNKQLYIKLDKGIPGYGGFQLTHDFLTLVQIPEYPKEITFLHKGALMALSSEKKLSVLIRGIPAVKFEIARVFPEEINHLVSQTAGKFANPKFVNYHFNQNNISQIFSEIRPINNSDPSQVQYTAIDLSKYLAKQANNQQQGLFLLKATDWDEQNKVPGKIESKRLVLITDMGLLVKNNGDDSHDVFVQSITSGDPVAGASVVILGKNGLPLLGRNTDASGHVTFPNLQDFKDEREPTVYVVKKAGDIAFIPYNSSDRQLNYSRYDTGGITTTNQETNLTAYLFSDRGVYRPGDPIHVGAIVKQMYLKPQPAGIPLEAIISDPRGMTVFDQKISLPASNYFTFDYQPNTTAPTGQYAINLFIVKDGRPGSLLGSTNVQVHEFLPDRMKINTHFSRSQRVGWVEPENLTAAVNLQNLFGTAAENRRITARIVLTPQPFQFANYKDYVFADPLIDPKKPPKTFSETLPEKRTDQQGNVEYELNLTRFDKATYLLTFFTEGFEADAGRSVATQNSQLVTPLKFLVGYKTDGDLNYLKRNSVRAIHFITINSQLQPVNAENLRFALFQQQTINTLVKKADGTYEYQSQLQETPITTTVLNITSQGTDYRLPTDKIGDYVIKVTDASGASLSKLAFSVVGEEQRPLPKQAELTVKLNKKEYQPGEDIELQITSPYTGAGLISLERDKPYAFTWFKTNSTNSVQKIRLPADFRGNGYLTVTFVRAWDSNEIFLSPLSYAVVPFTVNHDDQAIKINLQSTPLTKPGEALPIFYSADKPSKIIVFAVDEGILQVTDYPTPDPLAYFFRKNALEVLTQQIVDQILPNYLQSRELSATGGDGGEEMILKNLNPFKRKTDLPVVYWSGILDASPTPQKVEYLVPDYFNGALRIMAVAASENSVGAAEQKTQVRADFVITPNVPTFVAPGDDFDVSVDVANNVTGSGNNAAVQLALAPISQFQVQGSLQQSLIIPEGHERTAHFKLHAGDALGSARLDFTASLGNKISRMHTTLSLRPAAAYNTALTSGYNASKNNTITINSNLYPQYRNLTAELSLSPLILVKGLQRYLENSPFDCTEQLVSKAFATIALADSALFSNENNRAAEKLKSVIQTLRERQLDTGAFSYWPGSKDNYSSRFSTVYAMHFLTEARARGYNVPSEIFNSGIAYLQNLATQDSTDFDTARIQAYAIYVLTRNEIITTNYITNLQLYLQRNHSDNWRQDIAGVYIAASYQMLKNNEEAQRLISQYHLSASKTNGDFYSNLGNDAQYLAILARHFPERLQKMSGQALLPITRAISDNSFNTLSAAYSSWALSAYSQAFATPKPSSMSISEALANNKLKELAAAINTYLTTNFSADAKQLRFNADTNMGYFYQVTQAGFSKNAINKPIKQGLECYREYRVNNVKINNSTSLGTEIEVHVQLRSLDNRSLENVAIVDLLPGGFEVVRDSIPQDGIDYADIREDRVIFFTSVGPESREIVYRIKAVNPGNYLVPPLYAVSMYDPNVQASGTSDKIIVK